MESVFLNDIVKETADDLKAQSKEIESLKEISKDDVERVLRKAFDNIVGHLADGDKVYLINFFNLEPKDYKAKQVKNPQTQEPMTIEPYRAVLCKPASSTKLRLKQGLLGK